ncbi:MAG TPA: hypothetical protein VKA00_01430 [Trueperaceae bacterium]|nr:hypothetical protein [Trueperaceae bacterium]
MTNHMLATRIAKDQTNDLIRAAARRRLARTAAANGSDSRHVRLASRIRAFAQRLSHLRPSGTAAWRAAGDDA